jgi:hypothetical protein
LKLDGHDFLDVLSGAPGAQSRRESLYSFYELFQNRLESIRYNDWKLHLTENQLYDLSTDLEESDNDIENHQDIQSKLNALADRIRAHNVPDSFQGN